MSNEIEGIPDNLGLYDVVKYGGVLSRQNSYQPASPQSNYQPGQLIQFALPNELLDLRNSSFQFNITGSRVGGTFAMFQKDIRCIIKRMTISFGSKTVVDINNYGLLCSIMDNCKDTQWAESVGKLQYGTGDAASRQADFANSNRSYAVQLYNFSNHAELLGQVLPLMMLNVQLYINLYLALPSECITTDGTSASYVVNNCQFHCASLTPSPGWMNAYNAKPSVNYNFLSLENNFDTSILQAGITKCSKTLNFRNSSLIGLFFVMRPSANLQNIAVDGKLSRYDLNDLNGFQIRCGTLTQPSDVTTSPQDVFTYMLELFNKSSQTSLQLAVDYSGQNFVGGISLAKHPFQDTTSDISINGMNTTIQSSLQMQLDFGTPLPANYTLDIFGVSEQQIQFLKNGGIIWEN